MLGSYGAVPLSGLTVLDLSRVLSGPLASMLLGDLGAEVIKVERLDGGDDTRHIPPLQGGESHYFLSVNRNKRSIAVDLSGPPGQGVVRRLATRADVLIENFRPGVISRMGLDYESISKANPRIIYCSISGFGQTGPLAERPAFDLVIQALSGLMSINGSDPSSPVRMGVPLGDISGGLYAAIGVLAAVIERQQTGRGRWIDIGMLDSTISLLGYLAEYFLLTGRSPAPVGSFHHSIVPYGSYETADGHIVIATLTPAFWPRLCHALGLPGLIDDPRYRTNQDRCERRDEVNSIISAATRALPTAELQERLTQAEVPNAPILSIGEALTQPQAVDRKLVRQIQHPTAGPLGLLGPVIRFADADLSEVTPPPLHGQDTVDVLTRLGHYSDDEVCQLAEEGIVGVMGLTAS